VKKGEDQQIGGWTWVLLTPHLNVTCYLTLTGNVDGPKQRDTRREDAIAKCYAEKECNVETDLNLLAPELFF